MLKLEKSGKDLGQRYESYIKFIAHADESQPFFEETLKRGVAPAYFELAKLELEKRGIESTPLDNNNLSISLRHIQDGKDCCDFVLPAFLRMMYEYKDSKLLSGELQKEIKETILNYKYWMDEPGEREFTCNYFTENHQILQHCCELLAGQLYPTEIFSNGMTGEEHVKHAKKFINRWLGWRSRFGFSEWLSECYYEEDLLALVCIVEYSEDKDIAKRAEIITDIILFDIAVNSFKGDFSSTSGRTYLRMLVDPELTGVSAVTALLWGLNTEKRTLNKAALMMASFNYPVSETIGSIAKDNPEVLENKQRNSIDVEDGEKYGVPPHDFDNIMLYWGIQQYDHRLVIDNSLKTLAPWDGIGDRIHAFKEKYKQHDRAGAPVDGDPDFTSMTQADIYTYRTHNYMISCVQNYRPGKQGFQQQIWTATLGGKAVVYTSHPGTLDYFDRPNYWIGNGVMPKAVAHKNVAICIYKIEPTFTKLWQSHLYFPRHEFDQVVLKENWIFGRKGDGYVAVHCMNGGKWLEPNTEMYKSIYRNDKSFDQTRIQAYDFSSRGHANVWVCELGEEKTHGSFEDFVKAISASKLSGDIYGYTYHSPSQGVIETGWEKGLRVNGKEIEINGYPRYDNPYCNAEFNKGNFIFEYQDKRLSLDFDSLEKREDRLK